MRTNENEDRIDTNAAFERKPGGVFITKGMGVRIPAGALRISLNPAIPSHVELHVMFDVTPTWLGIAVMRVLEAEANRADLTAAWATPDDERVRTALEREFEFSMQAIMAAAVALDAFYACVKERIKIPPETKNAWRKNKTARHAQISEVLRQAFKIGPKSYAELRAGIEEVMRFRDFAVHPSGRHDSPVLHPVLQVGVEWRFVAFCAENAKAATALGLSAIAQLVDKAKDENEELVGYCHGLKARVAPIAMEWEEKFGPLHARSGNGPVPETT